MANLEQFRADCDHIVDTLCKEFPDFKFEKITVGGCEFKILVAFKRRYIMSVLLSISMAEVTMKTIFVYNSSNPDIKKYSSPSFKKDALEEIKDSIEVTLEYQHILLTEQFAALSETVQQLLYAPGGTMYQAAKENFEELRREI